MPHIDVLLVEDDPDLRDATTLLLEGYGFTVLAAIHGAEALAALERGYRPKIILLDLMMPVMDGHEFLERLAQLKPEVADLPVIVMTASHKPHAPRAQVILRKPFDMDDVLRTVDRFVPQRANERKG